jgi:hypothetical protein
MLSVIITQDAQVRDAFISAIGLEKYFRDMDTYPVYKMGKWVLVYDSMKDLQKSVDWTIENYLPERLYFPVFGKVVDIVREIGDVVLPNVLIAYNPKIETEELGEENRDSFLMGARFLEIYNEQKDYYVEDFWLSVWGIVVDRVPSDSVPEKLMLAYEADVYIAESLDKAHEIATALEFPVVVVAGVIEGKVPKNITLSPLEHTVKNMVTTFQLLEDE